MILEVADWWKKLKKKALLFELDLEKAFDYLSSDYLLSMLYFLGFGESGFHEFSIRRGLRQGDPLSPILFIIENEGLHVAVQDAIDNSLYSGLRLGDVYNKLVISHSFCVDDTLFSGNGPTPMFET
ncbi:uncharacterized protein [Rutidosis leptorrhynchoides]|uniref:uncharacterized protein n=1 Tax=Rutidosis leptorrhynchoides TaxID=125765 RepID=UPI003A9A11B4